MRFEPSCLGALTIPGRLDALELGAVGEAAAEHETKFNFGFDFATILSSLALYCIIFDIFLGQQAELQMLILNRGEDCSAHHV